MLQKFSDQAVEQLSNEIANAVRIFFTGESCSSLATRMVAMRLMYLGYQVCVVGATIPPSVIRPGDLLIICSESGSTDNICALASKVKNAGVRIISVTTQVESTLGQISDVVVKIAVAKLEHIEEQSRQLASSLFEQSTLLLFDVLFYVLAQNSNQSTESLWALHTHLE